MNEEFRKQHAKTVREIAERADPITKKRLLELANRYVGNGTPRKTEPRSMSGDQV